MSKKLLGVLVCVLFFGASVVSGFNIQIKETRKSSGGDTLYVGGSGGGNYSTIQSAIDAANPGDTVFVYDDSSPYYENVIVDVSINLIGENRDTTIINGNGVGNTINITENSVFINGFTIQNSIKNGIHLVWGNNCNIFGNNVYGGYFGIRLENGKNHLIHDCKFKDNIMNGVFIGNDYGSSVKENVITYCKFSNSSLHFLRSANNIIHNNTFISGGISFGYGFFEQNIDTSNTVNGKQLYYFLDEKDMIIDNWQIGQLILVNCTDFSIKNNEISETSFAIIAANSTNNTITNCEFNHNVGGVIFYNSWYNTIEDNCICNTSFQSTQFGGWPSCGIVITGSYNLIRNNIISTYEIGIWVLNYFLDFITESNVIQGNNLFSNYIGGVVLFNSSTNQVYHNNFIGNTQNAADNGNNVWDDGKYGNYWDDYEDRYPDAKPRFLKPWIWDTPYEISGGDNIDMYPLVNQWPKSKPRTIQKDIASYSSYLLRFLEQFPILQKILLFQRLGLQ